MNLPEVLTYLRPGEEWCLNGDIYEGLMWLSDTTPPTLDECEKAWRDIERDVLLRPIRANRNRLLRESDWTQIADAPANGKAWALYRQALRDLPATIRDPSQPVDWPTPPE